MLDTNIFVSMIFFPTEQTREVRTRLATKHQILVCDYVIDELRLLIDRKFPEKKSAIDEFFKELPYVKVSVGPVTSAEYALDEIRDKKDIPILASARKVNVDIFLTGDKDFLVLGIDKPRILTMKEFLEKY